MAYPALSINSVPPLITVLPVTLDPNAFALLNFNMPAEIVVTPVYTELLSALNIKFPAPPPSLVIPPTPLIVVGILISPAALIPKVNNELLVI